MNFQIFLNASLGFIEGFALIASPCILPVLPIILSAGVAGNRYKPWGIMVGFTFIFAFFSLFASVLTRYIGIDLNFVRIVAYVLIIILGIILISDKFSAVFGRLTQNVAQSGAEYSDKINRKGMGGFWNGILLGGLVSLVWVPCAGPILASAIIQLAVQNTFFSSFIIFLFFAAGAVLPMTIIAFFGRKIIGNINFLKKHTGFLRKIFGSIIVISAFIALFYTAFFPTVSIGSEGKEMGNLHQHQLIGGLTTPYPAPDFDTKETWLNSDPLTMAELHGKVVLVDFWTYSCINCIRTLPYLRNWYAKYHEKGLVIVGVHAPEFEFEKDVNNVATAIKQDHIQYPVVLDNQYVIWQRYHNQYWPAHYLIDKQGQVVYQHFGEGGYAETEHNIQVLLGLNMQNQPTSASQVTYLSAAQTPETYLGYLRASQYAGTPSISAMQSTTYDFPQTLPVNGWAMKGDWLVTPQFIESTSPKAGLKIHFVARYVYVVMGSRHQQPIHVKVFLDGKPVGDINGAAVGQSELNISNFRLYSVLMLPNSQIGELELQFDEPGAQVYTFTFGS